MNAISRVMDVWLHATTRSKGVWLVHENYSRHLAISETSVKIMLKDVRMTSKSKGTRCNICRQKQC